MMLSLLAYIRGEIDAEELSARLPRPISDRALQLALLMGGHHGCYLDPLVKNLPDSDDAYWSGMRKLLTRAIPDLTTEEVKAIYGPLQKQRPMIRRYVGAIMGPEALADLTSREPK